LGFEVEGLELRVESSRFGASLMQVLGFKASGFCLGLRVGEMVTSFIIMCLSRTLQSTDPSSTTLIREKIGQIDWDEREMTMFKIKRTKRGKPPPAPDT